MVRKCLGFIVVIGVVLASVTSVGAAGATQHYTIANSGSTDSGTCGPDWANDRFDRDYTISAGQIVEQFKNGTFTTIGGPSPGACEAGPDNGHTVAPGVTGKMQGIFVITITGGVYNPNASCTAATCQYTADVIQTYFGAAASGDVTSFFDHYSAGNYGEWKNASVDRGGNHGDIYTS
jgi:hypothetical protein